ncbi:hypothetical protein Ri1_36030 [Aeromonas dhakensis]|nr:hypothetical protein Ri1_36030 [Aeromonas dhakensis]
MLPLSTGDGGAPPIRALFAIQKETPPKRGLFLSCLPVGKPLSVLAGLAELDVRVTLLGQAQVDHGRRDVGEVVTAIEG